MIEQAWQEYEMKVIPPTAPKVQRVETKRAFYAGVRALLGGLMNRFEEGEEPTKEDLKLMDGVVLEIKDFYEEVKAGEA